MHFDGDTIVLDQLNAWQGRRTDPVSIATIERAIVDAAERYPGLIVWRDPWELRGSIERLQADGIKITEFTFGTGSVEKLSKVLYGAITAGDLRVYPDDDLEREILGLRTVLRPGGGCRLDHAAGGFSDRAIALALAAHAALGRGRGLGGIELAAAITNTRPTRGEQWTDPRSGRVYDTTLDAALRRRYG